MEKSLYRASIIKRGSSVLYGMPSFEATGSRRQPNLSPQQVAEKIEKEAYDKGFSSGEQAGLRMGQQKAGLLMDKLEAVLSELTYIKDNMVKEMAPQVFQLAIEIARKIILEEISQNPELMVGMVKEGMRKLERTGPITIKINPTLHDLFRKHKPELLEVHPEVVFDVAPSMSKTGAVVIGSVDEVVTDIDEQLKNLAEDIGDILGTD